MSTYYMAGWIVLLVALVVVEAVTTQLVTIWFAFGALVALIANLLDFPIWLQLTLFVTVSVVSLILTRPLAKKFTQKKLMPTNADRVIGQDAIVIEEINNSFAKGFVAVAGVTWTARSADGEILAKDTEVTVEKIEGVKLIVSKK